MSSRMNTRTQSGLYSSEAYQKRRTNHMKHSEYGSVFSTAAAENREIKYSTANKLKASRITQVVLIRSALYDAVPLQRY